MRIPSLQESKDHKTYFLKIHAPWDVLATYAEVLKIKVPFKESDIPHGQDVPLEWLSHPLRLPEHIMRPQPDYFTYPFDKQKSDFFLISDKDTFFPPSTRSRIVSVTTHEGLLLFYPALISVIRQKRFLMRLFPSGVLHSGTMSILQRRSEGQREDWNKEAAQQRDVCSSLPST